MNRRQADEVELEVGPSAGVGSSERIHGDHSVVARSGGAHGETVVAGCVVTGTGGVVVVDGRRDDC